MMLDVSSSSSMSPLPAFTSMRSPRYSPEDVQRRRAAEAAEVQDAAAKRAAIAAWPLVNGFCAAHGLPPSLRLLEELAAQGDWLHFLAEAQSQTYGIDDVKRTASSGFADPNLAHHICHVVATLQAQTTASAGLRSSLDGAQPYTPIPWTHSAVTESSGAPRTHLTCTHYTIVPSSVESRCMVPLGCRYSKVPPLIQGTLHEGSERELSSRTCRT
jgi:hypothetical protein